MKLINSSYEILPQAPGMEGVYKQIELAGRTCYKSEDKITTDSAKKFVDAMVKSQHCYTGLSEVLTEKGWIPWNSYNGEKVATVNESCHFTGFVKPNRVIRHTYTGKFYYYPNMGIEVTDGHRMFGVFRESKNDFYNTSLYSTFVCGSSYKDNNGRNKTLGERMFKSPRHCNKIEITNPNGELIGFWLGDGCYAEQSTNKLVFHLKKSRKIEYLKTLCEELGYSFEIGKSDHYKVGSKGIGKYFNSTFYKDGNKYIPEDFGIDSPVMIHSIIRGLINSDGSYGVNTKTITFTNTSYSIISWINNFAVIGGYTVSFRGISHETTVDNPVYKILLLDTNYTINNDSRNKDSKVIITNKTEEVYCVTVPTGLIIVRGDNGVTSICGNCAMLEHGTVYLRISKLNKLGTNKEYNKLKKKYTNNPYSKCVEVSDILGIADCLLITTNYRVLVENNWLDDLEYLCEPTEYHEKRYTVKFTADIHFYKDATRHRVFSWAIESTRYCNYLRERFGMSVNFMKPSWIKEEDIPELEEDCKTIESIYFKWINKGYQAQHAAYFLSQGTKADIVMTGFASDWGHFFRLRTSIIAETGKPHPDVSALADPLYKEFIKGGYMEPLV